MEGAALAAARLAEEAVDAALQWEPPDALLPPAYDVVALLVEAVCSGVDLGGGGLRLPSSTGGRVDINEWD